MLPFYVVCSRSKFKLFFPSFLFVMCLPRRATNDKNKMEAALDAVLADDPTTAVASSPGDVLLLSPTASATATPAVMGSTLPAAASSPSTPEPSQESKQKMTDIDTWVNQGVCLA